MSPMVFFFFYSFAGLLMSVGVLAATGGVNRVSGEVQKIGPEMSWFTISVLASVTGAFLSYVAIGEKNATLASLIEISYPLFVAFFVWLFFREVQFNIATVSGALLVFAGISMVCLGNR